MAERENNTKLNELRSRQMGEVISLRTRHTHERRDLAKEEGVLVSTLEELGPDLKWEVQESRSPYKRASGFGPERRDGAIKEAFYCDMCDGWIAGEPYAKAYDDIGPLSGSKGTKYNCNICNYEVGEDIVRMSLTPRAPELFE